MRKKYFLVTTIIITLAMLLTGCTTFENFKLAFIDKPKEKEASIQIGIYEPMSGADSEAGELEIKGIELAHELYPTVNGKVVELIYADNSSDIYAAETAIKEIIVNEPSVILGSYGSVYSLVAGDYIREAKIPTIAITNTNPLVTKNNDFYFRVCYIDSNQGDILAKYILEEKKAKKAGILLPTGDDAAIAMATAFADRMEAETGDEDAIMVYEEYVPGNEDFSVQLELLRRANVQYVLLPGEREDSAAIIKQAKEFNLDIVFLGDNEWADYEFFKETDGIASEKNVAFVNFFLPEEAENKEAEKFLKAYQEKYGANSVPDDAVALGYDAYVIAIDAIDKADDAASSKQVREVLAGQNQFQGASGAITFNSMGDPIKTAYISTWEKGGVVSLYTMEPM